MAISSLIPAWWPGAVSYTHLDVYKRQVQRMRRNLEFRSIPCVMWYVLVCFRQWSVIVWEWTISLSLIHILHKEAALLYFECTACGGQGKKRKVFQTWFFPQRKTGKESESVSYTHLDVYKRQVQTLCGTVRSEGKNTAGTLFIFRNL